MAWYPALKVLLALGVVYLVLPRLIFAPPKTASNTLDRLLIDVIRMTALIVAAVHILVPLHLFQWTGLAFTFLGCWFWFRLRPMGWGPEKTRERWDRITQAALYLLEAGSRDGNDRVKQKVRLWWRLVVLPRLRPKGMQAGTAVALGLILPLALVLAASLAIRLWYPLTHSAFIPADNYVHLVWTKSLSLGELFRDGIYPRGMHSVLAVASTITPTSSFELARFAGPFMNTFFVFLIYVVSVRATRHAGAGLVAAAIVGVLGTRPEIGLADYRQIGTLPQEFAVMMAVIGLLMAAEYVARPSRDRLVYVALAGFITSMSHPLAAGLVVVGTGAMGFAAGFRGFRPLRAVRMWLFSAAGIVAGHLYVVVGLISGAAIYGGVTHLNPMEQAADAATHSFTPIVSSSAIGMLAVIGMAIGLAYGLYRMRRHEVDGALTMALSFCLLVAIGIEATGNRFLYRWYAERWEELVVPLVPIGLALAMAPVALLWNRFKPMARATVNVATGTVLSLGLIFAMPPKVAAPEELSVEYEISSRILGTIMKEYDKLTYTVVGPPEWYQRVFGAGYHLQLIDFVDKLTMVEASNPGWDLPIGTKRIFVYTEKEVFRYRIVQTAGGEIGARYQEYEGRSELMADVTEWMQTYARYHSGVRVFYEDDQIRVWLIKHPPNPRLAKRFDLVGQVRT